MLQILIPSLAVVALAMLGLGLGVLFRGRPLPGGCSTALEKGCPCGPLRRKVCPHRNGGDI